MAATVSEPLSPASAYRPIRFRVSRTDPVFNQIDEIFIADAGDVSALGNGLEVGDVVISFTSVVQGSIPAVEGQTILLDSGCGDYAGVWEITNAFTDSGTDYLVIDAPDEGDYTPPVFGGMRVWLNNYTAHCRVLIYTDPAQDPQIVDLKGQPDPDGDVYFHVELAIRDYFSHRIETFMEAIASDFVQDAHGVTALFYRVHLAEVYDVPDETEVPDPFDGTHTLLEDDTDDVGTFRVAVNAVHPYANALVDWSTAGLDDFTIGGSTSLFLTNAPRTITLGRGDRFRLHMLTDPGDDYTLNCDLRIAVTAGANIQALVLNDATAAFSVACGPADIYGIFPTATSYTVQLRVSGGATVLSETFTINVTDKCTEGSRKFGWLGKLGGVDLYTFTGREFTSSKVKRATVRKPYGAGTGFDWTERQYRSEPERIGTVSTAPVPQEVRSWLVRDLVESPNVNTIEAGRPCTAIILSGELQSSSTGPLYKPVTMEYRLGVDNLSQQA